MIIGITGFIRSGKTTVANYLQEEYGYMSIPNVQVLRRILTALDLPLRRDLLAATGDALFSELGRDIIARARVAEVLASKSTGLRYVIDGIRYPEELVVYRELASFKLIALQSTDGERYRRAINSEETVKDGEILFDDFLGLNSAQSEKYVPELMAVADIEILNNQGVGELKSKLDAFLL